MLAVAQAAEQETQSDQPVAHDHDDGEHRIAGERGIALPAQHDRSNERDLDHRDRDGGNARAERLADDMRDRLRVMDGGEHGADQDDAGDAVEERCAKRYWGEAFGADQRRAGRQRDRGNREQAMQELGHCGTCFRTCIEAPFRAHRQTYSFCVCVGRRYLRGCSCTAAM